MIVHGAYGGSKRGTWAEDLPPYITEGRKVSENF